MVRVKLTPLTLIYAGITNSTIFNIAFNAFLVIQRVIVVRAIITTFLIWINQFASSALVANG